MLSVYALSEYLTTEKGGPKRKTRFTRIGVAFKNRDGSLTLKLDALPVFGQCQVRKDEPRKPETAAASTTEEPEDDDLPY